MFYALNDAGKKIQAVPRASGFCPGCGHPLVPKCGEIVSWHWAHQANDCDPWYEPETRWHLWWKQRVRPEFCEVVMENHRADLVGRNGLVIELQHGSLEPAEAAAREGFYRNRRAFLWVFDASPFMMNLSLRDQGDYVSFRWKWPRMTHARLKADLWWDLPGSQMLRVRKIHPGTPCGGWGEWVDREEFIETYLGSASREGKEDPHPGYLLEDPFWNFWGRCYHVVGEGRR